MRTKKPKKYKYEAIAWNWGHLNKSFGGCVEWPSDLTCLIECCSFIYWPTKMKLYQKLVHTLGFNLVYWKHCYHVSVLSKSHKSLVRNLKATLYSWNRVSRFFQNRRSSPLWVEFFTLITELAFIHPWDKNSISTVLPKLNMFFGLFGPLELIISFCLLPSQGCLKITPCSKKYWVLAFSFGHSLQKTLRKGLFLGRLCKMGIHLTEEWRPFL